MPDGNEAVGRNTPPPMSVKMNVRLAPSSGVSKPPMAETIRLQLAYDACKGA
jgi:hypothetical protein